MPPSLAKGMAAPKRRAPEAAETAIPIGIEGSMMSPNFRNMNVSEKRKEANTGTK